MVDGKTPAETLAPTGQLLAAGGVEEAVFLFKRFGAAGGQLVAGFGIGEFGTAGVGEGLLGRVGDLDQMCANAVTGEYVEARSRVKHSNLIKIREEFKDKVMQSVGEL